MAIALALFWRICTEIGRDNSFCRRNARWLSGIGFCALLDTGYCAVGTVTIELLVGSPIWILGMGVCMVGLAIALAAFLLSHLDVMLARRKMSLSQLSEQVDVTIANLSVLKTNKAKAVRFTTLEAICRALDCQPGDLLEYVEE